MPWKKSKGIMVLAMVLALLVLATACGKSDEAGKGPAGGSDGKAQTVYLNGAGASFPYPLYSKWISEYNKVAPHVNIDYQSIGSGGGIKGIIEETVDFAGSDAPMKDEQMARARGEIIHIPTVIGAVVITYNLEGVNTGLKLTPEVIGNIFLGKIKKWNDPAITAINPGVELPDKEIAVVHRSDGSGTTNIFTDYLSSTSPEWKEKVGTGTAVEWPVGIGAKGNEGVAGTVKQTPGGIGYVELAYAVQNQLPYAFIKNLAGKFVEPTLDTTTAAAAGAVASMPEDMRVSIVNAPGENAYPIAGFTYLLLYKEQMDRNKGTELAKFLWWAVHDGEAFAKDLLYAPLPENVRQRVEARIKEINYQGEPLFK
ncbi:phosphate ABC transporter substrate-binding protein PstS [Moorella sulfitireducens (nom. illeg.)]|uniref:phosphate ABC transporter substrate-binding protein PstS n=1 Tax=Neomoorella sulfitireducens TaxID=2972948 RepID=UPI0021ABA4A8|nr:phosphate ABC transporter substrate-binding protein PstS [Moorella sulfitireducens]